MKKLLFTSMACLFMATFTFGQFYDQDAQYHSEYYWNGFFEGYAVSNILSDTTINGQTANRLEWSAEYWQVNGPGFGNGERVDEGVIDTLITYKSNDSVYVYRDGGFNLAFKTDGNQGDIWDLGQFPQTSNTSGITDDHAYLIVTSALNTVINGELLRVMTVEPCKQDGSSIDPNNDIVAQVAYGGEINERMGPSMGMLYLDFAYPSNFSEPPREIQTLCYNSTNLGMVDFDTDKNCLNDIESAGLAAQVVAPKVAIYPNPSTGAFTIAFDQAQEVRSVAVADLTGKEVEKYAVNKTTKQIAIKGLERGMYQLVVTDQDGSSTSTQTIIVE